MQRMQWSREGQDVSSQGGTGASVMARHVCVFLGLAVAGLVLLLLLPTPVAAWEAAGKSLGDGSLHRSDELGLAVGALLVWLLLAWVGVVAFSVAISRLPGAVGAVARAASYLLAPRVMRAVVAVALGAGIALGSSSAYAADPVENSVSSTFSLDWPMESGIGEGAAQQPATTSPSTAPPPSSSSVENPPQNKEASPSLGETTITVLKGDTLWDIAKRHLNAGALEAQIATECQRWWEENKEIIGADPSLIKPGQVLRKPV